MVFENGSIKRVYLKDVPDTIYFSKEKKYFTVLNETDEIINRTLIYKWIKVEEISK